MGSNMKSPHIWVAFWFAICVQISLASYQYRVGGPRGWIVPTGNETETYNQWAQRNRFHVDDDIYFKYKKLEDSVLLVTQAAYETCNTSNPTAYYDDGNTVIKLRHSGPYYFISGIQENCNKGQKLIVVVMASSGHSGPGSYPPSPSPFQSGVDNGNNGTAASVAATSINVHSIYFSLAFASIACVWVFWPGTFP